MKRTRSPHSGSGAARKAQRGFTLIEVMTAGVILSVFVMGLSALWTASSRRVDDLVIKQKAVFVLNAEMERLSALYGFTDFGEDTDENTFSASGFDNSLLPAARLIYPSDVGAWAEDDFVTTSFNSFRTGSEFRVYRTPGDPRRTYVWLDRDRNVAARLSWTEEAITVDAIYCLLGLGVACVCEDYDTDGSDKCRKIELYLEYPYRTSSAGAFAAPSSLQTMSLQTVVGRRR